MPESCQVLLVDDDLDILEGASFRLQAAGYITLTAHDGDEGLAKAIDEHPDAIVMDLRMPRMHGLECLRHLRSRLETAYIPVVMLSACVGDQQAALDAGARFFIRKPYQGRSLLEAVEKAIEEK